MRLKLSAIWELRWCETGVEVEMADDKGVGASMQTSKRRFEDVIGTSTSLAWWLELLEIEMTI